MIGFLAWRGSPQRLDPIIGRAIYPLVGVATLGAMIYAIVRTIITGSEIGEPLFAVAAILFVIVAALLVLVVTDPVHTPVSFPGFAAVVIAANLASVSSSISTWGTSNVIWNNWGPLVVGILILAFAEFRPGRDLAAGAAFSVLVVGTAAALETFSMPEIASPLTSAVIASTPVILFGTGAAVFSYRMSLTLSRVSESAFREQSGLSRRVRLRLRELLRESGRDALAVELMPFLEGVLARGEVTEGDTVQARRISAVLRSVIITDMGLPWLQRLERAHPDALVVHDDRGAAETFTMEQKVALRALVNALVGAVVARVGDDVGAVSPTGGAISAVGVTREEGDRVASGAGGAGGGVGRAERAGRASGAQDDRVHVRIEDVGAHRTVFLRAPYSGGETGVRVRFGTSITVMNAVFGRSSVTIGDGELRLLFAYEP
jgi:hypothetical protein